MFQKTFIVLLIFFCTAAVVASPEVPGAKQKQPIALVGGTIHPVSRPALLGTLIFDGGKITAVGKNATLPKNARVITIKGKHVYPGLFDAYTNIGLIEINAVRATRDTSEAGQINPNVKAQVAVNPDSELIPVTRSNGVLLALTAPSGGLISGRSAVIQLDGWTWEDMTLRGDIGMHIQWPRMSPVSDWWVEKTTAQQRTARDKAMKSLQQTFDDARAYQQARRSNGGKYPREALWEGMLGVLGKKLPLIVAADDIQQIQAAVAFAEKQQVRLIILGGYDAPHCAELLKKYNVPVIIGGVYRLPQRRNEPYDAPFTLARRLQQAGVAYCISGSGRFGASNVRNLPYHAATAVAYGLSADEALKAITLYPAQILGVADRVGSLANGKDATLIITDGDPLETTTQVESAYIIGRPVDLSNRHKRLWKKYQEKYRRQQKSQ